MNLYFSYDFEPCPRIKIHEAKFIKKNPDPRSDPFQPPMDIAELAMKYLNQMYYIPSPGGPMGLPSWLTFDQIKEAEAAAASTVATATAPTTTDHSFPRSPPSAKRPEDCL